MLNIRAGMYAWGGPGTVRLLQAKYHSPKIDTQSFLSLYDKERLQEAKRVFALSDVWVTYSWGFSDKHELEDYQYIEDRLQNFISLGLRTHAYVQGLNVVNSDFPDQDFYCRDIHGKKLPYSRGRSLICPNNPRAREHIARRVTRACEQDFDGVFIDNLIFGAPPSFVRKDFAPFLGCACKYCQNRYQSLYEKKIPRVFKTTSALSQYLMFQSSIMTEFVAEMSALARKKKKYFGVNLFDPFQVDPLIYQGYELQKIEKYLDYFFIENHFLPSSGRSNAHLQAFVQGAKKPVVVLSYNKGIGFESEYFQKDYDSIAQESKKMGYIPCYKVSEFTTKKVWHTTDFSLFQPLQFKKAPQKTKKTSKVQSKSLRNKHWYDLFLAHMSNILFIRIVTLYFEHRFFSKIGHFLYKRQLHGWKNFVWEQTQ